MLPQIFMFSKQASDQGGVVEVRLLFSSHFNSGVQLLNICSIVAIWIRDCLGFLHQRLLDAVCARLRCALHFTVILHYTALH